MEAAPALGWLPVKNAVQYRVQVSRSSDFSAPVDEAVAIAEIATNRRVEGGGEYFIISRSFGKTIGSVIGISLYLSQAVSVAFYMIAFAEAFTPLKPLEAIAQRRLLVASDVGGHRELIRDGETGRLFRAGDATAFADAVTALFADRASWPVMREAGRRFVEQERNWAASIARYAPVYEALVGRRR